MEIILSTPVIFMLGAFLGALLGRTATFGILAFIFLVYLVLRA